MPFSRSQNSRTAKKSAFIRSTLRSYPANKKVGRYASSDFRALDDPANYTVLGGRLRSWPSPVKRKQTVLIQGKMEFWNEKPQPWPRSGLAHLPYRTRGSGTGNLGRIFGY